MNMIIKSFLNYITNCSFTNKDFKSNFHWLKDKDSSKYNYYNIISNYINI